MYLKNKHRNVYKIKQLDSKTITRKIPLRVTNFCCCHGWLNVRCSTSGDKMLSPTGVRQISVCQVTHKRISREHGGNIVAGLTAFWRHIYIYTKRKYSPQSSSHLFSFWLVLSLCPYNISTITIAANSSAKCHHVDERLQCRDMVEIQI